MLPRQLRAEARRHLRPVSTPVAPSPPPQDSTPVGSFVPTPPSQTTAAAHVAAADDAPPVHTPSRPNTVKSKGGVPGAKTLPAAMPAERPKQKATGTMKLVPEVIIEPAATTRVFYQVRAPVPSPSIELSRRRRPRPVPRARDETWSVADADSPAPVGARRALCRRRSAPCWIQKR